MHAWTHVARRAVPVQAAAAVRRGHPFARTDAALFVTLSALHGAALVAMPSAPLVAIGLWWNSNTIAHNWIHRPFFRTHPLDVTFSAWQSVLLGIPQTLWRDRHLAHHAGAPWRLRLSARLLAETTLVVVLWGTLLALAPAFFLAVYLPGYLAGLALCALQGHYEHAGGATSHYGRLYNVLCFNDGYHVEHHAAPGVPWRDLPDRTQPDTRSSRWPAPLRWLDACGLEGLERLVLRSTTLQRLVVAAHRRAIRDLLRDTGPRCGPSRACRTIRRVVIVGGGLFPRTAVVLHDLAPEAALVVIDASRRNLDAARAYVERCGGDLGHAVTFRHERFTGDAVDPDADLIVVPLSYQGDRAALYARPPGRALLVHDWLWNARGESRVVSALLLKRVNLVRR